MNWHNFSFILPSLLVISASLGILMIAQHKKLPPGSRTLPFITLGVTLWLVGHSMGQLTSNPQARLVWANLETLGFDLLPLAWMVFLLQFSRAQDELPGRLWLLLAIEPLLSQILVWLYGANNVYPEAGWLFSAVGYNPQVVMNGWAWLHLVYWFALILLGVVVLFQNLLRQPHLRQEQIALLVVGALAPGLVLVIEVSGVHLLAKLDLTPLAFTLAQIAFTWGMYRNRLFDFAPPSRENILARLIDGVIVLDTDGRIMDFNPAAEEIFRLALDGDTPALVTSTLPPGRHPLLGRRLSEALPQLHTALSNHLSSRDKHLSSQAGAGTANKTRLAVVEPPTEITLGTCAIERVFEARVAPLLDGRGQLNGYILVLHDMTLRKQAASERERLAQQLADQVRLLDAILETTPDQFQVYGPDGHCLYASPRTMQAMGLEPGRVLGHTWRELGLPGEMGVRLDTQLEKVLRTGESITAELVIPTPDGPRPFEQVLSPFRDPHGNIISVVSTMRDVSAYKLASEALERSLGLLRATLESSANGVLAVDHSGKLLVYNQKVADMLGLPDDWSASINWGQRLDELLAPARNRDSFVRWLANLEQDHNASGYETLEMNDGRWVEVYVEPYHIGGQFSGWVWNLTDVTQRRQAETALRLANDQLSHSVQELERHNREVTLLSEMGNMLQSCASVDEAYAVVADFAQQVFPHHSGGLYVLNPSRTLVEASITWGSFPPDELVFAPGDCWGLRRGRPHVVKRDPHGQLAGVSCQHVGEAAIRMNVPHICAPLMAQGEAIGIFHLQGEGPKQQGSWENLAITMAEHIAMLLSNLALRERLRLQSIHDPLTGLYNRRHMEESLERELRRATRHNYPVGMLMLDIDHFKRYNDTFGHAAGDILLQTVAAFLRDNLRSEDIACRYGGEEFTVILPDTSLEDTRKMAERLWQGVRQLRPTYMGRSLGEVTVSLGAASYPKDGKSGEDLLNAADEALYRAKSSGRDRIIVVGQAP